MKCLSKYKWVKLYRAALPQGKGIMGYWARLAVRAAFRQGNAQYCGYTNTVTPGMWSGGIVGLKSILGVKRRSQALQIMNELQHLGYISYSLDRSTKSSVMKSLTGSRKRLGLLQEAARFMQQKDTGLSVCPDVLPRNWQSEKEYLMSQTHGWICGATRYTRITAMRFLFWLL